MYCNMRRSLPWSKYSDQGNSMRLISYVWSPSSSWNRGKHILVSCMFKSQFICWVLRFLLINGICQYGESVEEVIFCLQGGYRGFYARNTIPLTPKIVNGIHKRGGTILGTSRGGHDTSKIVDSIQDRGINQVYIACHL